MVEAHGNNCTKNLYKAHRFFSRGKGSWIKFYIDNDMPCCHQIFKSCPAEQIKFRKTKSFPKKSWNSERRTLKLKDIFTRALNMLILLLCCHCQPGAGGNHFLVKQWNKGLPKITLLTIFIQPRDATILNIKTLVIFMKAWRQFKNLKEIIPLPLHPSTL